jgi:large subunit ribosomal protein L17
MRHGKTVNHLGRTSSHRKALLSNLSASLILHKRITTTLAKAKALRKHIEPIITKSKQDTTHSRRTVFSYLADKEATAILFRDIAPKIADRPGGYTRILKLANRLGDNAEMAIIELVDFNELMLAEKGAKKAKTTRRGRASKKKDDVAAVNPADETPKAAEGDASTEEKAAE